MTPTGHIDHSKARIVWYKLTNEMGDLLLELESVIQDGFDQVEELRKSPDDHAYELAFPFYLRQVFDHALYYLAKGKVASIDNPISLDRIKDVDLQLALKNMEYSRPYFHGVQRREIGSISLGKRSRGGEGELEEDWEEIRQLVKYDIEMDLSTLRNIAKGDRETLKKAEKSLVLASVYWSNAQEALENFEKAPLEAQQPNKRPRKALVPQSESSKERQLRRGLQRQERRTRRFQFRSYKEESTDEESTDEKGWETTSYYDEDHDSDGYCSPEHASGTTKRLTVFRSSPRPKPPRKLKLVVLDVDNDSDEVERMLGNTSDSSISRHSPTPVTSEAPPLATQRPSKKSSTVFVWGKHFGTT